MSCLLPQPPQAATKPGCPDQLTKRGFITTPYGCFYVNNTALNWTASEAACRKFGSNVYLAQLDTKDVGTVMLFQTGITNNHSCGSMAKICVKMKIWVLL